MAMNREDALLLEILQEKKSIYGFLQTIFGFLSKHTDFYHEMKHENEKYGFPPGYKEKLVYKVLKEFEKNHPIVPNNDQVPPAYEEVEVESEEIIDEDIEEENQKEDEIKFDRVNINESTFHLNEYFNGAKFDKYCWSQTYTDLEIHILLPENTKSSKDLLVKIDSDEIKILKRKSNDIIVAGKLHAKCKKDDAVWSISEGKLQITLDKIKPTWWNKLFIDEPPIDLSKTDCARDMSDLSEEDQASIERMKYDYQQKVLGLPTSQDIKNRDILQKAWNVEGSPFKGQPFDPSAVQFQ